MDKKNNPYNRNEINPNKAIEDREEIIRISIAVINQMETEQSRLKSQIQKSEAEIIKLSEELKEMRSKNEKLSKGNSDQSMKFSEPLHNKDQFDKSTVYKIKVQEYAKELAKLRLENNRLQSLIESMHKAES